MAKSDKTISIGFKIEDGADGLKSLIMNAEDLRKVFAASVVETERLKGNLINFASLATGIDSISSTINSALSFVKDMTSAYDVQATAETRLEQVMRNSMNAREEEIQSIKDFCSAQQQIGVVGDEVQLAGAQELATYLEYKSSLEALIPVMNDMLVQQNGLASTGENAAQIATMLGKVMGGQVGALSRYGYKFDEAQEKVLKYGTEAEKVRVLVDVVSASVGGMNEAMAKTDAGKMQQLANNLGDWKEVIGGIVKGAEPVLTIGANATTALGGVIKLVQGVKALNATLHLTKAAAGWIGLALTAAASAMIWFLNSTDDATDSLHRFKTEEERAAEAAERLSSMEQAADDARKSAASSIQLNISKLKNFNGTKAEEKKLVKEMNDTYGQTMGYFKSVASWYQTLIKNSKAYCDQMVAEAKARKYADQIAELELQRDKIARDSKGEKIHYSTKRDTKDVEVTPEEYKKAKAEGKDVNSFRNHATGKYVQTVKQEIPGTSDLEKAQTEYDEKTKEINYLKSQMDAAQQKVKMPVMGELKVPELDNKAEKTRLQEINALIAKYQEQYAKASDSQKEQIRIKVDALMKEKDAIELAKAELDRPLKLDSIETYNKEIAYQSRLRQNAAAEDIAAIDDTITRLQEEKTAFELTGRTGLNTLNDYEKEQSRIQAMMRTATAERLSQLQELLDQVTEEKEEMLRSAKVRVSADKISSYKELEEQLALCNELLRVGTEEERKYAEANLPALREKEKAMSAAIAAIGVAARPEDADSLDAIGAAISLLDDKIQRASANEIEELTRTRMAFEEKKRAYERGIEIPAMQKEVGDMMKLPDKVLRVKIEAMGFEGLSEKLREIQMQLDDIDNPPTDGQRKALEELKQVYEEWRSQCAKSFDTLQSGWSNIKSVGNGLQNLTETIQESNNAWQLITGVVDDFIQIAEGIMGVLKILEMIGVISKANAAAKTAEAVATVTSTAATTADVVVSEAATAAEIPEIAANKALTTSYLELAAARYMAAHADIPFAGFGIGAGFATSATALVKGIGLMEFANGGIVSGPTLGLIGEYAGARSNPEVVAPLNKLKELIGTAGTSAPVIIGGRIRMSGRELSLVLENQSKITGLSR